MESYSKHREEEESGPLSSLEETSVYCPHLLLLPAASNLWLQGHQVFLRPIVHGCGESMQRGISSELQLVQERRPLYICQPHMPGEVAMLSCNNSAPCHQAANGFWFRFNFQQTAMPTPHPSAGADSAAELTALVNGCLTAYHTSL